MSAATTRGKRHGKKRRRETRAAAASNPYRKIAELSFGWYWEQDAELRFTRLESGRAGDGAALLGAHCLGRRFWEAGLEIPDERGWEACRSLLAARQPLHDVVMCGRLADGTRRCLSVSGAPRWTRGRRFLGYRGIARDVTESKLREEELQRFTAAMDATPDMIYIVDRETMRFVWANQKACELTAYSREQLLNVGPAKLVRVPREELERMYDEAIAAGPAGTVTEIKAITGGGVRTVVEVRRRALRLGGRWIIVTTSQDISRRKRAEQATLRIGRMYAALSATNEAILRAKSPEELYRRAVQAAVEGGKFIAAAVVLPDPETTQARVAALSVLAGDERPLREARISFDEALPEGRGPAGIAYRTLKPCVSDKFLEDERTGPWRAAAEQVGVAAAASVPLLQADRAIGALLFYSGEKYAFDEEIVRLLERMAENVSFALGNFEREAERKSAEARIQFLATHDGLTGLPNRVMFNQVLELAIESAKRYGRKFTVLFIDLDRFKVINDTLGHDAGDALLKEIGGRLKQCLRASDVVARLGGDEFVALVQEVGEFQQASVVARKIVAAANRPVPILGRECRVSASVGITMYPADAQSGESLLKNADLAMYLAKEEGRNSFQFYSKEIKPQSLERVTLESGLRRALERNELYLHYLPKIDLGTGRITGVEALLRWRSPELGAVLPAQFIPVAEEIRLMASIGKWVLKTACAQNAAWQRQGLPPVCMAVNLSPRQFTDPGLLGDVAAALEESGMAARHLELEVTENMVMYNVEQAIGLLTAIKRLGVRVAIDDFGTGYSSLSQLRRLPIDTLKVDRSLIREVPHDSAERATTEAIIAMGKSMSVRIVAEGVETEQQQAFLRAHACDEMQGFHFSKPVPPEEFAELLHRKASETS